MKFQSHILLLIIFFVILILPTFVLAQEGEEQGAVEQIREAVTEKVKERIEGVTSRQVGIVGNIEKIQEATLELVTEAQSFVILTSDETDYSRVPGSSNLDREEIALNEHAIVLGTLSSEEENTVRASVIQLIEEPTVPERQVLFGKLKEVGRNSFELEMSDGQVWTVNFFQTTDFYAKNGTELEDLTSTDLEVDDLLIVGGSPDDEEEGEMDGLVILRIGVGN